MKSRFKKLSNINVSSVRKLPFKNRPNQVTQATGLGEKSFMVFVVPEHEGLLSGQRKAEEAADDGLKT